MNKMSWNSRKDRYEGELANGKRIAVEGVEYSEAVADGGDPDELLEATQWEALIGDNQNVYYIDEQGREINA